MLLCQVSLQSHWFWRHSFPWDIGMSESWFSSDRYVFCSPKSKQLLFRPFGLQGTEASSNQLRKMGLIIRTRETWKWKLRWQAGLWADASLLTGFAASCTPVAGPSWPASSELGCEGVGGISRFSFLMWVLVDRFTLWKWIELCSYDLCGVMYACFFFNKQFYIKNAV